MELLAPLTTKAMISPRPPHAQLKKSTWLTGSVVCYCLCLTLVGLTEPCFPVKPRSFWVARLRKGDGWSWSKVWAILSSCFRRGNGSLAANYKQMVWAKIGQTKPPNKNKNEEVKFGIFSYFNISIILFLSSTYSMY